MYAVNISAFCLCCSVESHTKTPQRNLLESLASFLDGAFSSFCDREVLLARVLSSRYVIKGSEEQETPTVCVTLRVKLSIPASSLRLAQGRGDQTYSVSLYHIICAPVLPFIQPLRGTIGWNRGPRLHIVRQSKASAVFSLGSKNPPSSRDPDRAGLTGGLCRRNESSRSIASLHRIS